MYKASLAFARAERTRGRIAAVAAILGGGRNLQQQPSFWDETLDLLRLAQDARFGKREYTELHSARTGARQHVCVCVTE